MLRPGTYLFITDLTYNSAGGTVAIDRTCLSHSQKSLGASLRIALAILLFSAVFEGRRRPSLPQRRRKLRILPPSRRTRTGLAVGSDTLGWARVKWTWISLVGKMRECTVGVVGWSVECALLVEWNCTASPLPTSLIPFLPGAPARCEERSTGNSNRLGWQFLGRILGCHHRPASDADVRT